MDLAKVALAEGIYDDLSGPYAIAKIIISATWMAQIYWFSDYILASLSQFILAPALWSFWVISFGLPHPVLLLLGPIGASTIVGFFLVILGADIALSLFALSKT